MKRAALIADVRGWAFDVNLRALARYVPGFEYEFFYVEDRVREGIRRSWNDLSGFDVVFAVYHRWGLESILPWERTLGSLRAEYLRPEASKVPNIFTVDDYAIVNRYAGFHVVRAQHHRQLRPHCPKLRYLTNPVDTDVFCGGPPEHAALIACWNGNAKHSNPVLGEVKGLHLIEEACRAAKVELKVAEYHTSRLPPSAMPQFYAQANIAICASLYEGASNTVMEAMSSGLALIATDCGTVSEMWNSQLLHFGDTGIIVVERSAQAIADALLSLRADPKRVQEMGQMNRAEIHARWSWKAWAERYEGFLRSVC